MAFLRLVALLLAVLPSADAFGARLEPFASHQGGYSSSRTGAASLLRVHESKRSESCTCHDTEEAVSFQQLLDGFDFPPAAYQNLNDFVVAHGMIDGTFSHLQERADLLASESFGVNSLVTEASGENCIGDDDEECLIPEEWKRLPAMMEGVDLMEFLGITRVRPLMVSTTIYRKS